MGRGARKAVFEVCEQQTRRPACASAQTDQRLCYAHFWNVPYLNLLQVKFPFSRLVSEAEETCLSLAWSETPKTGFVASRPLLCKGNVARKPVFWVSAHTPDSRQSKTLLTIDERGSRIANTVFSIAICRQSGDKWQSKTLFLTIFLIYVRRQY